MVISTNHGYTIKMKMEDCIMKSRMYDYITECRQVKKKATDNKRRPGSDEGGQHTKSLAECWMAAELAAVCYCDNKARGERQQADSIRRR